MQHDLDNPDARLLAEIIQRYEQAARRLREQVVSPPGGSDSAQAWNQNRAARLLVQVDAELTRLKQAAGDWTGRALTRSIAQGTAGADRQLKEVRGTTVKAGTALRGTFDLIDRRAVELLARDTVGDLIKAADSMRKQAGTLLRHMAATGVTNGEVNAILTGAIVEGKPRQAIEQLRDALKAVHGEKVTIQTSAGPRQYDVKKYAAMVARTKMRETTVKARHARLADRGIDLVLVTGRRTINFCTAYMDKVFSLTGTHPKYPAISELPGDGPPFHPNCSKGTAPFIEDLADPEDLEAAEPDDDLRAMLATRDTAALQRQYQAQNYGRSSGRGSQ